MSCGGASWTESGWVGFKKTKKEWVKVPRHRGNKERKGMSSLVMSLMFCTEWFMSSDRDCGEYYFNS